MAEKMWAARLKEHLPHTVHTLQPTTAATSSPKLPDILPSMARGARRKIEPALLALRRLAPMVESRDTAFASEKSWDPRGGAPPVPQPRGELELRCAEISISISCLVDGESHTSFVRHRLN